MDSRDFLLTTDFPLDKVVGFQSGSLVASGFNFSESITPHGLGFAPLVRAKWSTSPSFDISYDVSSMLSPTSLAVEAYANNVNLVIRALNFSSTTTTLYYQVFYLMPSNVDAQVEPTQSELDDFNLSTDYNYTKLLEAGVVNGANGSIEHGLGYYPQTEVWWEESDGLIRPVLDYLAGDNPYATISPTTLTLTQGTFTPPTRWHYRIYTDEL